MGRGSLTVIGRDGKNMVLVKDTQLIDFVKPPATGEEHKTAVLLGNGAGSGLCAFKTPLKCILDDEFEGATRSLLRPGKPK